MTGDVICPACGETEEIHGEPVDNDIRLTCHGCGTTWLRGAPTCRSCGGKEVITALQAVTRLPRGTLRAIVGMRDIPLCPSCDAAVLTDVARNQHVPEEYLSQFLRRPAIPHEPLAAESAPLPPPTPKRTRPPLRAVAPRPTAEPPQAPADPTVRVAIDLFLIHAHEQNPGAAPDTVALVQLGRFLGPATRLSRIDTGTLADWFDQTWRSTGARARAAATVRVAVRYWVDNEWLPETTLDPLE